MADYKATALELTGIANHIRLKFGIDTSIEYPSDWEELIENGVPASGGSEITPVDPTAEYKVTDTELVSIANKIRTRNGTSAQLEFPSGFEDGIDAISGGSVEIVSWSTGTDAQIVAMIQAAHAGVIDLQQDAGWAVGNSRSITLDSFEDGSGNVYASQTLEIEITSFNEYENCGNVLQFDFKQLLRPDTFKMNETETVSGGYGSSLMKTTTIPAIVNALPSWLKGLLIEFSCPTHVEGGSSTIVSVPGNKLALRSEYEYTGLTNYGVAEGTPIPYYVNNWVNRKKMPVGIMSTGHKYWLRTPRGDSSKYPKYFIMIEVNGNAANTNIGKPQMERYVAPFGCI